MKILLFRNLIFYDIFDVSLGYNPMKVFEIPDNVRKQNQF